MELKLRMISESILKFISNSLLKSPRSCLRFEISKLPQNPTFKQQLTITHMRVHLGKQIKDFLNSASSFLPTLEEADLKGFEDESIDTPKEESVKTANPLKDPADEDDNFDEEDESKSPSVLPEAFFSSGSRHFSKGSTYFFSSGGRHFSNGCTYFLGCIGHHFHYGYLSCGGQHQFYLSERVKNMLVFALLM